MKKNCPEPIWFFSLMLLCPLIWWVATPWNTERLLASGDVIFALTWLHDALVFAGNWDHLLYRSDILGGAVFSDSLEKLPLFKWFSFLSKDVVHFVNFQVVLIQSLLGLFSMVALKSAAKCFWKKELSNFDWRILLAGVFMAFHPVIFARFAAGHLNLLWGLLSFAAIFSWSLSWLSGQRSVFLTAMTWITLVTAGLSSGHQLNVYTLVFGGPMVLALYWTFKKPPIALFVLGFSSFLFILPDFMSLLSFVNSSDALRHLGVSAMKSSLQPLSLEYFFKNLFYVSPKNVVGGQSGYIHEVFYPIGMFAPLAMACILNFARPLKWVVGVVLLLMVTFSLQLPLIADAIVYIFPPIEGFRVPARVLMLVSFFSFLLAFLYLMRESQHFTKDSVWITFCVLLLAYSLPGIETELALWLLVAGLLLLKELFKVSWTKHVSIAALLILTFLLALFDWPHEFFHRQKVFDRPNEIHAKLKENNSGPFKALQRSHVAVKNKVLNVNTGVALSLSTIDGYWQPTSHFLKLSSPLLNIPFDPMNVFFQFDQASVGFKVLQQLYNVRYSLEGTTFKELPETNGAAWFSQSHLETNKPAEALLENQDNLKSFLADQQITAKGLNLKAQGCDDSKIVKQFDHWGRDYSKVVDLLVETSNECPLTIATNYAENLVVELDGVKLSTYPAYGALLGVIVPKSGRLIVKPVSRSLEGVSRGICFVFSFMLLLALIFLEIKKAKV